MTVFVFPGQGSQHRGMGRDLFDEVPEFAAHETEIDRILGYSLRALCIDDPDNRLKDTRYTQPSLYAVNALHYYKALRHGESPSFVAGHSLGEFNALLAAGVFDLLTGLRIVQKRGEIMSRAKNGAMAAVVGIEGGRIAEILRDAGLSGLEVANYNAPSQTIISGPAELIARAQPIFEKAGARAYVPLQVSAAFHSSYMAEASRAFADYLRAVTFAPPRIPVIANVTAEPYPAESAQAAKDLLVRQIAAPVQWTASVRHLLARGETIFKELGPGNVLTRLIQQIQQDGASSPGGDRRSVA